jgi:hypothetical protein
MAGYTIDGIDYSPYNMPILTQLIGEKARNSESSRDSENRRIAPDPQPAKSASRPGKPAKSGDKFIKSDEAASRENSEKSFLDKGRANNSGTANTDKPKIERANELSEGEKEAVEKLEDRDQEVKSHEQAHQIAGGNLVRGKNFSYTTGPDGKRYAIGGEVQIDISEVPNDPEATIQKMQQVKRAALAPSDPSMQDRAVAARAAQIEAKARSELRKQEQQAEKSGSENSLVDAAINAYQESDKPAAEQIGTQVNYSVA